MIESAEDPAEFTPEELEFLVLLGPALMALYGYSATPVGEIYERARTLSQAIPTKPHFTPILNGLRLHYLCRFGTKRGLEPATALLAHAEVLDDDASRIEGRKAIGSTMVWTANCSEARETLLSGIALYDAGEKMDVMRLDSDSGLTCHSFMSLLEWASGYPDRGTHHSEQAVQIAHRSGRTFGLGECLSFRSLLLHFLRDHANAETTALEAYELAEEHNYVLWKVMSLSVYGATLVWRGDSQAGLERLHSAARLMEDMSYVLWRPMCLTQLGHGYGKIGEHETAFTYFDEALALVESNEENFWGPEIYRHRAKLLLELGRPDDAESAFNLAIETATKFELRTFALRAAIDLAGHWQSINKIKRARAVLLPIFETFDEGFSTADLQEAKRLLI